MDRSQSDDKPSHSEQTVQYRVQSFLQGRGENKGKNSDPYFVHLDSELDWIALSKDAVNTSTIEDRNPSRRELAMHDRTYDIRPMRVRKTDLFLPSMDPDWLNCMKETLKTCQFSDPDPAHQLREVWETVPKPKQTSRRKPSS